MRGVLTVMVLLVTAIALTPLDAVGQDGGGGCRVDRNNRVICTGEQGRQIERPARGGGGAPSPTVGRQVAYEIFDNDYETFCTRVDYVDFGDPARAARANASTDALLGEIQAVGGRLCPGVEAAAVVLSPLEVALSYKEQVVLPDPAPVIAPGWAITGLPAYLESNGRQTAGFPFQTDLGPLDVRAKFSHLVVDWGDGRGPQRYDDLGGPYPGGKVSTVYGDTGVVDVHVRQYWYVTWSVGGVTGEFLDMYSEASIPAFEVEQVQAVIQ